MLDKNLMREGIKDRRRMLGAVLTGVVGGVSGVAQAWLLASVIVDAYRGEALLSDMSFRMGILLSVIILRGFMNWMEERFALGLAGSVEQSLRRQILKKIANMGPVRMREEKHG